MAAKEKIGVVVSAQMENTCIVAVSNRVTHKRYKKVITKTKRYAVHDHDFSASVGDKVKIREVRPMSKTKNWVLINVLSKSST